MFQWQFLFLNQNCFVNKRVENHKISLYSVWLSDDITLELDQAHRENHLSNHLVLLYIHICFSSWRVHKWQILIVLMFSLNKNVRHAHSICEHLKTGKSRTRTPRTRNLIKITVKNWNVKFTNCKQILEQTIQLPA
jgi:hypothetical protein